MYIVAGRKWNKIMYVSLLYWEYDQEFHSFIIIRNRRRQDSTYGV